MLPWSFRGIAPVRWFKGKFKNEGLVKNLYIVIPANAGIQIYLILLDPGLRRGDARRKISTFYEAVNNKIYGNSICVPTLVGPEAYKLNKYKQFVIR